MINVKKTIREATLGELAELLRANRGDLMLRAPVFIVEAFLSMTTDQVTDVDGPMTIDLDPRVLPEDQWIVEGVSGIAGVANIPTTNNWLPPVSGLWLCPPSTPQDTNLSGSFDINLRTRPVPIPLDPYTAFRTIPSTSAGSVVDGAIGMTGQSGFQVSVPGGWFARFSLITEPGGDGTTRVGPGAESYGKLTMMVRVLRNLETFEGDN